MLTRFMVALLIGASSLFLGQVHAQPGPETEKHQRAFDLYERVSTSVEYNDFPQIIRKEGNGFSYWVLLERLELKSTRGLADLYFFLELPGMPQPLVFEGRQVPLYAGGLERTTLYQVPSPKPFEQDGINFPEVEKNYMVWECDELQSLHLNGEVRTPSGTARFELHTNSPDSLQAYFDQLSDQLTRTAALIPYPNPTGGVITVASHGEGLTVQVYNIQGHLVAEKVWVASDPHPHQLDLSDQPAGLYLVKAKAGGQEKLTKLFLN